MARSLARDHDEKRGQILATAASVFATEGYDRASMTRLATECGISKANIYHYYDSKDAILFDILDRYLSALNERIMGIDLTGKRPDEALRATVREIMLAYQGQDNEHRVQMTGVELLPAEEQRVLKGYQRSIVDHVASILEAAAPEVFDGARAKLIQATMALFGMLNWYFMWNAGAGTQAREDYAALVSEMVLNGVGGL